MTTVLLLILLALCAVPAFAGAAFHVSSQGDDSASGTRLQPWRTLHRASAHAFSPGETLQLEGGASFSGTLALHVLPGASERAPVTVTSYGTGGRATILAGEGDGIRVENAGGVVIHDLIVQGSGAQTNRGTGVKFLNTLPHAQSLDFVHIAGVEAHGFGGAQGQQGEGIYVGGAPADGTQSGFRHVRIERCVCHDNMYYGIYVTGVWDTHAVAYANADVEISHCTVYDNSGDPHYTENHSGSGILLDDCDGGRISRCVAHGNGAQCAGVTGGPCGIWAHNADRITIEHCDSYANRTGANLDGAGFDFDGGVTHSLMEDCTAHDNDGAGFLVWNYSQAPHRLGDNILRRCTSTNDGRKNGTYAALHIGADGSASRITNLTVEDCRFVMGPNAGIAAAFIDGTRGVTFTRCTFAASGGVPLLALGTNAQTRFDGNTYTASDGAFSIRDNEKTYTSAAAWRAACGER